MTIQHKKQLKSPLNIVSVILAAGKSTRMGTPDKSKVCFPVNGKPAILGIVETMVRIGIHTNFVVIGAMGEQVINALDPLQDKVVYCRQIQQRGTGHATKTAAGILQAMQFNGHVLVTAGDKIIDPQILIKLIQLPHDLSFLVGSIDHFPGSGRVVYDNNSPVDIFEFFDIQKLTVIGEMSHMLKSGPLPADQAKNLIHRYIKQSAKAAAALGDLYENVIKGQPVTSEMLARIPAGDIHKSEKYSLNRLRALKHANLSVYLFRASALYKSLTLLSSHNAQQEEYLPDVVSILAENGYHISTLEIDSPEQVMSFNTQEELKAIQEHYS